MHDTPIGEDWLLPAPTGAEQDHVVVQMRYRERPQQAQLAPAPMPPRPLPPFAAPPTGDPLPVDPSPASVPSSPLPPYIRPSTPSTARTADADMGLPTDDEHRTGDIDDSTGHHGGGQNNRHPLSFARVRLGLAQLPRRMQRGFAHAAKHAAHAMRPMAMALTSSSAKALRKHKQENGPMARLGRFFGSGSGFPGVAGRAPGGMMMLRGGH
jgi:hypothetical protein